jgi:hypothetical protein
MARSASRRHQNALRQDEADDAPASRHPRESGNPAGKGRIRRQAGIPAFAGMTSPAIPPERIALERSRPGAAPPRDIAAHPRPGGIAPRKIGRANREAKP